MSITSKKSTIALAASAALTASLALSPTLVSADTNPFATAELSSGYMQVAEGKCGSEMKAKHEAKCGSEMKAKHEAKCGSEMKAKHEAKCGATKIDKAFMKNNPSYSGALGK
ncbi:MAG: putative low-complexity protein [Methylophagaceae bacterium]|jgi:uncharacterized low-complexity protein